MISSRNRAGNRYSYDPEKDLIGEGHFSKVYRATDKQKNNERVAIKLISQETLDTFQRALFDKEIAILKKISGDVFLGCRETYETENEGLHIVMDYCEGETLSKKLIDSEKLSEDEALEIAYQVISAFVALPNSGFKTDDGKPAILLHRDIKPGNILFKNGRIKVIDFGLSEIIENETKDQPKFKQDAGTLFWMSPQVLRKLEYSSKSDVFSLGVVLYEMIHGQLPWGRVAQFVLAEKVISKAPVISKDLKPETIILLDAMLGVLEEDRIGWDELAIHPAFARAKESLKKPAPIQLNQPSFTRHLEPPIKKQPEPSITKSIQPSISESIQSDQLTLDSIPLTVSAKKSDKIPFKSSNPRIQILFMEYHPPKVLYQNKTNTVRILED